MSDANKSTASPPPKPTPTQPLADPIKRSLILKFEYRGQQYELASLTTTDTVGDLRAVVCSMLSIDDFKRINLKTLQPTKVIDTSDDSKPLSEIFRQTRERLVVEDVQTIKREPSSYLSSSTSSSPSSSKRSLSNLPNQKHHKAAALAASTFKDEFQPQSMDDDSSSSGKRPLGSSSNALQDNSVDLDTSDETILNDQNDDSPLRQRKIPKEQADFPVCSSTGYLLRHPVPSNNSCLFISVHFCLTNGVVDDQIGRSMRKIIADTVASDKLHFDDAFLGKSNSDYCQWILDNNNWGGAIELSILCKYYETEIVAIDVKNTKLNRFGEDSQYRQRMLLLYDGIHYDPLKFQPLDDNQPIQTLFSTENLEVLTLAEELAKEAKESHQFTDIKTITMKCEICGAEFDSKSVKEHAERTGHVDFIEKSN